MQRRVSAVSLDRRGQVLLGAGVVLVLIVGVFSWQAVHAIGELKEAQVQARILKQKIVDGDVAGARASLKELDRHTTSAADSTDGPLWAIGSWVPFLGQNVDAVRTGAREIDAITDDALPGIVRVADAVRLETFRPNKGKIDLKAVATATPALAKADGVFVQADDEVGKFDTDSLVHPLRGPMGQLQGLVRSSATAASAANTAARLLPQMLGADGEQRTYLLVILNNAEVRSIAGMPGSVAVLKAKNGTISMERQGSISDVKPLKKPVVELTKDEKSILSSNAATDMRNTATDPDFPRVAQLITSIVGKRFDQKFDGAIAVDPVALSNLLTGIGPVKLPDDITLTSSNAVQTLLNGVYAKYPVDVVKQDDVFADAARRIFDATVSGQGNSQSVVRGLVRSVGGGHLMLWSRDAGEQKRIAGTDIAGALDRTPGRVPHVGVYVNDAGSAKMSYYLQMSTTVRSVECLDDGVQVLRVITRLTSNAPPSAAFLSPSIVGLGKLVPRGVLALQVQTFGPTGGSITDFQIDGQSTVVSGGQLYGRRVSTQPVQLQPGGSTVLVTTMSTDANVDQTPVLDSTPGIVPNADRVESGHCD